MSPVLLAEGHPATSAPRSPRRTRPRSIAFISGSFPEQPIAGTGSLTFTEVGDRNLTFTAGAAGPIRFTLGP